MKTFHKFSYGVLVIGLIIVVAASYMVLHSRMRLMVEEFHTILGVQRTRDPLAVQLKNVTNSRGYATVIQKYD